MADPRIKKPCLQPSGGTDPKIKARQEMASLREATLRNISYSGAGKIITALFSAVANVVLARNLISSDYGIVSFAMFFISFLAQFDDFGINSAAVQKSQLRDEELYTGLAIKCLLGVLIFTAAFFAAPLATSFFNDKAIVVVLRVLSLNFLISIFAFLPNTLLTRELNYKKIVLSRIGSSLVNSSVAIIMAINGYKYWSIVAGSILSTVISVAILNALRSVKIKFAFDANAAKKFLHFGSNIFLSGLITFVIFNADNFIIGAMRGKTMLGYYAMAFTWGTAVCNILTSIVLSVMFPTYAKMEQDKVRIKKTYLSSMEYICFLVLAVNFGLLMDSKEFFIVLLGRGTEKWLPALMSFRILLVYGICRALLEPVGSVIMAIGKTKLFLKATMLAAALQVFLLYPALKCFGIEGVAVLVTVSYLSQYWIYFPSMREDLNISFADLFSTLKPSLVAGLAVLITGGLISINVSRETTIMLLAKAAGYFIIFMSVHGYITRWRMVRNLRTFVTGSMPS